MLSNYLFCVFFFVGLAGCRPNRVGRNVSDKMTWRRVGVLLWWYGHCGFLRIQVKVVSCTSYVVRATDSEFCVRNYTFFWCTVCVGAVRQDCYFTRGQYQQLVYQALSGLPGLEIVPPSDHIYTLPPAIVKPVERWTGKQVRAKDGATSCNYWYYR